MPEPDGPDDRRQLAGRDREGDTAERVDGGLALAEAAGEVAGRDDGRRAGDMEDALVGERALDRCVHEGRPFGCEVHAPIVPAGRARVVGHARDFGSSLRDDSTLVLAADAPRLRGATVRP